MRRARLLWSSSAGKRGPQSSPGAWFTSPARWPQQPWCRRPRARRQPPASAGDAARSSRLRRGGSRSPRSTDTGRLEPKFSAAPLGPGQGGEVAVNMAVERRLGGPREAGGLPSVGRSIPDEADPAAELVGVLTDPRDPDWTKLVKGREVCLDQRPSPRRAGAWCAHALTHCRRSQGVGATSCDSRTDSRDRHSALQHREGRRGGTWATPTGKRRRTTAARSDMHNVVSGT